MNNVEFRIVKKPDRAVLDGLDRVRKKAGQDLSIKFTTYDVLFSVGEKIEVSAVAWSNDESLAAATEITSQVVKRFILKANQNVFVRVDREPSHPSTDKVVVGVTKSGLSTPDALRLVSLVQSEIGAVDLDIQLGEVVGEELGEYYARREGELQRLESTVESFHASMVDKFYDIQSAIEREVSQRKHRLEKKYQEKAEFLEARQEKRLAELEEKEIALREREAELDDRDSRHVRREIRKELKEIFRERNDKFTLTDDTKSLRGPVHWILAVLLVATAIGLGVYTNASFDLLVDEAPTPAIVAVGIRQLLFGAAFIGVATFWARWQSKWADRFAQEEFLLKRLELDIDRASWLVEMAMEWETEKGSKLPDELVSNLSAGLFSDPSKSDQHEENAADQLARALFGSAAQITVDPAGTRVELDRKARKELERS